MILGVPVYILTSKTGRFVFLYTCHYFRLQKEKKIIYLKLNFTGDINISFQGSGKNNAMDWIVFPRNSYIEVLTPIVREGNGNPLKYPCLETPMDGGAWQAAVHAVTKSRTQLSNFTFTFHFHALEKEMVTHSSVLAWRIPGAVEPGGLLSMGSHRIGHDWSNLAAAAATPIIIVFGEGAFGR